ncbi:3-oxoacyl-[acyl-carrier-protein] synthase III C-terminal domain-containing protein [Anaerolineales bacterium HSG6]|nr:3-oxoacyl-[acyl-carrier-protein] synthase III C-terminal domain-containing protein [Anaerolineales bacterium HSG6]
MGLKESITLLPIPIKIVGLGRYLPERIVRNDEVERLCGLKSGWIKRWSGVEERRWITDETSSFMGAEAAKEAVKQASLTLTDLDLIINASGTPEQAIPDGAALIQRQLGLGDSGISCFTTHATCLSFLVALDLSSTLLLSERYTKILIVSSDVGSAALNFNEPESASLMGDGAGAVVVTRPHADEVSCIHTARLETYGEGAELTVIRGGGSRRHPHNPLTQPEDNLFHMEGTNLLRTVRKYGAGFLERFYPGLSSSLVDIDLVIPHQASLAALRSLRHFGWSADKMVWTLPRLGNCIAASLPLTLYEAVQQNRLQRGDKILLIGTGAGLSFGGLVLTY